MTTYTKKVKFGNIGKKCFSTDINEGILGLVTIKKKFNLVGKENGRELKSEANNTKI